MGGLTDFEGGGFIFKANHCEFPDMFAVKINTANRDMRNALSITNKFQLTLKFVIKFCLGQGGLALRETFVYLNQNSSLLKEPRHTDQAIQKELFYHEMCEPCQQRQCKVKDL